MPTLFPVWVLCSWIQPSLLRYAYFSVRLTSANRDKSQCSSMCSGFRSSTNSQLSLSFVTETKLSSIPYSPFCYRHSHNQTWCWVKEAAHPHRMTPIMPSLKDSRAWQGQGLASYHPVDPVQLRYWLLTMRRTSFSVWKPWEQLILMLCLLHCFGHYN